MSESAILASRRLATSQRGWPSQGAIIEPEASSKNRMRVTFGRSGGAFCARAAEADSNSANALMKNRKKPRERRVGRRRGAVQKARCMGAR